LCFISWTWSSRDSRTSALSGLLLLLSPLLPLPLDPAAPAAPADAAKLRSSVVTPPHARRAFTGSVGSIARMNESTSGFDRNFAPPGL
jgi:hypothetical protein